jgi:HSP20 family protein
MFELAVLDDLFGFPQSRQMQSHRNENQHQLLSRSLMRTDFVENKDNYVLNAELPGYDKDKINLQIQDGVLTMEAEKSESKSEDSETYHFKERSWGKVHRSFRLPDNANQKDVSVSYVDGVLKLTFPKVEKEAAKKLTIS